MCGRYAIFGPVSVSREGKAALHDIGVDLEGALDQRDALYNIAPTQKSPILAHVEDVYNDQGLALGLEPALG